jgi:hypothetical protein
MPPGVSVYAGGAGIIAGQHFVAEPPTTDPPKVYEATRSGNDLGEPADDDPDWSNVSDTKVTTATLQGVLPDTVLATDDTLSMVYLCVKTDVSATGETRKGWPLAKPLAPNFSAQSFSVGVRRKTVPYHMSFTGRIYEPSLVKMGDEHYVGKIPFNNYHLGTNGVRSRDSSVMLARDGSRIGWR